MDIFSIDSWDLNKRDKEIKILSQADSLSGNLFHLSNYVRPAV